MLEVQWYESVRHRQNKVENLRDTLKIYENYRNICFYPLQIPTIVYDYLRVEDNTYNSLRLITIRLVLKKT